MICINGPLGPAVSYPQVRNRGCGDRGQSGSLGLSPSLLLFLVPSPIAVCRAFHRGIADFDALLIARVSSALSTLSPALVVVAPINSTTQTIRERLAAPVLVSATALDPVPLRCACVCDVVAPGLVGELCVRFRPPRAPRPPRPPCRRSRACVALSSRVRPARRATHSRCRWCTDADGRLRHIYTPSTTSKLFVLGRARYAPRSPFDVRSAVLGCRQLLLLRITSTVVAACAATTFALMCSTCRVGWCEPSSACVTARNPASPAPCHRIR